MRANQRITSSFVEQLFFSTNSSKPSFYWDAELKGFGIKVSTTDKRYIAETKVMGKTCRVTIDSFRVLSAEEARKKARTLLGKMHDGVNPNKVEKAERYRGKTFNEVCEEYISHRQLSPRTKKDYLYHLNKTFKSWQSRPILDISRDETLQLFVQKAEESPAQANQAFRFARAIFKYAKSYRSENNLPILLESPIDILAEKRVWKRLEARNNHIKDSQLPAVWQALWNVTNNRLSQDKETARDLLILLLFTGLRLGEAQGLRWKDIDFKEQTFSIPKTKNHQSHTLPMSDHLYAFFQKRKETTEGSSWVFPSQRAGGLQPIREIRGTLNFIISQSEVTFTPHDLRRTFISIAKKQPGRYNIFVIKRLANHKVSDITADYMQIDMSELRTCMQEISAYILEKSGAIKSGVGVLVKKSPPPPIKRNVRIRKPSIPLLINLE